MSHTSTIFVLFSLLFSLTLAQQCFEERDGRVVIQAESADLSGTKFVKESGGGRTWVRWTGPNLFGTPESGGDLIYKFTCTPGTKKIFIMSSRPDNGQESDKQNDVFVRFNDGPYQKLYTQFGSQSGIWKYSTQFDVNHNKFAPTFTCNSGDNLLYLAGRSENYMMDFIALVPGNVNSGSLPDNLSETPCGMEPRSAPTTEAPPTTMPPTTEAPPTTMPPTTMPPTTMPPTTEATTTTTMTAPEVTPAPEMPSVPEPGMDTPMGGAEPATETPMAKPGTMEMPGSMEEKPMVDTPTDSSPVPLPSVAPNMAEETNMQPEVFPLPTMEDEMMVDPMMSSYEPEMSVEYTPVESYEMMYESAEPETGVMGMEKEMGMDKDMNMDMKKDMGMDVKKDMNKDMDMYMDDYSMPKINRIAMPNEPAALKACDNVKVMFSYTASRACDISGVVRDAAGGVVAVARQANVQPGVGMVELDIALKQRVVPGGQYYFEGLMHGKKDKMMDAVVKTDKVFAVRC